MFLARHISVLVVLFSLLHQENIVCKIFFPSLLKATEFYIYTGCNRQLIGYFLSASSGESLGFSVTSCESWRFCAIVYQLYQWGGFIVVLLSLSIICSVIKFMLILILDYPQDSVNVMDDWMFAYDIHNLSWNSFTRVSPLLSKPDVAPARNNDYFRISCNFTLTSTIEALVTLAHHQKQFVVFVWQFAKLFS